MIYVCVQIVFKCYHLHEECLKPLYFLSKRHLKLFVHKASHLLQMLTLLVNLTNYNMFYWVSYLNSYIFGRFPLKLWNFSSVLIVLIIKMIFVMFLFKHMLVIFNQQKTIHKYTIKNTFWINQAISVQ